MLLLPLALLFFDIGPSFCVPWNSNIYIVIHLEIGKVAPFLICE